MNANQTYLKRKAACEKLLKEIATRLEQHAKEQSAEPANWLWAGDLGHTEELLSNVSAFLNPANRS